jgi:hypothetical protein
VGRSNRLGGGLTALGHPSEGFDFARFSSEFVRFDQRSVMVKSWFVLALFARSSCSEFFDGYRRLDRHWKPV